MELPCSKNVRYSVAGKIPGIRAVIAQERAQRRMVPVVFRTSMLNGTPAPDSLAAFHYKVRLPSGRCPTERYSIRAHHAGYSGVIANKKSGDCLIPRLS